MVTAGISDGLMLTAAGDGFVDARRPFCSFVSLMDAVIRAFTIELDREFRRAAS